MCKVLMLYFLLYLLKGPLEKPAGIKTHLRNMIIVPEMIGSIVGVYNGKAFNGIEIKVLISILIEVLS